MEKKFRILTAITVILVSIKGYPSELCNFYDTQSESKECSNETCKAKFGPPCNIMAGRSGSRGEGIKFKRSLCMKEITQAPTEIKKMTPVRVPIIMKASCGSYDTQSASEDCSQDPCKKNFGRFCNIVQESGTGKGIAFKRCTCLKLDCINYKGPEHQLPLILLPSDNKTHICGSLANLQAICESDCGSVNCAWSYNANASNPPDCKLTCNCKEK